MTTPPPSRTVPGLPGFGASGRFHPASLSLLLAFAVLAVYAQTLSFGFVNYDDEWIVAKNPAVRGGLTLEGIRWAFTTDLDAGWIPLTWLSRMLDVSLFGLDARGHHLVNVLLHLSSSVLLFRTLLRATGLPMESAAAAALFAVHPVHVESVAWVTERKDVLAGFFWMLSLHAYVRYAERPGTARYLAVAAFFSLALLSKPVAVTLPCALLLLDAWPLRRFPGAEIAGGGSANRPFAPASTGSLLLEKAPLLLLSAAASVVTIVSERGEGAMSTAAEAGGILHRAAVATESYASYLGMLVFPRGLTVFYPPSESGPGPWPTAAAAILLAGITGFAVASARRRPWIPVGWFWFLGVLVPMIGLVPVGDFRIADRCLYIPAIGIYLAAAFGLPEAARGRIPEKAAGVAMGAALLALAAVAFVRAGDWRDSGTLFGRALSVTEGNWVAHGNLGHFLEREGRVDEAIRHYREAIRIRPTYADAHVNLGVALQGRGEYDAAAAHFREAIRLFPDLATAHNNLGVIAGRRGDRREALARIREAIRIRPGYAGAWNNLGITLLETEDSGEAEAAFREAVRLDPSMADAWNNLGVALARQGRAGDAKRLFEEAVRLAPDHPGARSNLERYEEGGGIALPGGKP